MGLKKRGLGDIYDFTNLSDKLVKNSSTGGAAMYGATGHELSITGYKIEKNDVYLFLNDPLSQIPQSTLIALWEVLSEIRRQYPGMAEKETAPEFKKILFFF